MVKANNRQTTGSIFDSKLAGRDFGKYRAERLISRHDFRQTITLLATNKETKERVVLKAFGSFSPKSRREFDKEIAAFKKLESRHGVLLPLETFEYEGDYFIVTEYKNGGDLRGWLETKPKAAETLDVFARIAESIDYIHENKIIHRDIKPENVVYEVLDGRITPYLMDFGISVTLSDKTSSFITQHGFGTIRYKAPELLLNKGAKMTKAVDIYAFGLMLYEALEGHHPITSDDEEEANIQIISGVIPTPETTIKKLGGNAGFILTKTLSKNPEDRPKTATEVVTQIGSQYLKYVGKTYGKYITEEYLGQGLYGATCKAHELNRKSKKAIIKLLAVSQAKEPEIGKLADIEHDKGILPIIDAGYENGAQYLISEYLDGDNLRYVLSSRKMEILDILKTLKPLSETLGYLHGKGIFHCDLKPENILLERNGVEENPRPFISDYGVARITEITDVVNASGSVLLGSLGYLAPEVLDGMKPSAAADVYSLGVIIYEAIEGKTPFDAKSLPVLIKQKMEGNVPVPEHLLKNGGIRAARILLKALNVRPEKRQRSAADLVSHLEDAVNNRSFMDRGSFIELWVKSHKLLSDLRKNPYVLWALGLLLSAVLLIILGIFSFTPAFQMSSAAIARGFTPIPPPAIAESPAVTDSSPPPTDSSAPVFVLSDQCELPFVSSDRDYLVPGHLLLEDVYRRKFNNEPTSNDLYAIAYYNNRKIVEGYSKYHVIDPISLDVRRGWKIFIPPQDWIDEYKKFPLTIPLPALTGDRTDLDISGSSVLSHLSAQISKCSIETTKIGLVQINSDNTVLGLQDLCQGKVDLFGANREVDATMMAKHHCGGIELEKFEVARYAMVVVINKNNPHADDMQKNPLTDEELTELLTTARSWKNIRGYWDNNGPIAKHYPSLKSGEFEIVKNGIFPDIILDDDEDDIPGLNIAKDKQSLLDAVAADVNAVGIVDYASYQRYENKDQLIAIPINGVYVSSAIASDNGSNYPLMATLYLYAEKNAYETNKTLHSFVNYYLSHELDFLDDLGYLYPSRKGYMGNRDTVP